MAVTFNKKTTLIFISITILFICFGFIHTADAQTYYATGTLVSKNLFSTSDVVGSIDYFGYNCTTTATTTLKVQFSQDNSNWYSATHTADTWNTLSNGDNLATSSALSLFGWSDPYFYYRMQFETSDTSATPVLDEIRVYWTQGTVPTVTTTSTIPVYVRNVVANGNVTDDGGGIVTTRGFKYGLTETDTWSVSETGSFGEGAYSLGLTGLDPVTTYYIRAYATNEKGTSYGAYVSFTTNAITYYSSGTLISKNLFLPASDVVGSIDYFGYNCTTTATSTLKVQFSQDKVNWYSSTGTSGWDTLSNGDHLATGDAINLSTLNWSDPYFYYKILFETSDTNTTPVLDETRVHWAQGTAPTVTTATTTLVYVRNVVANGNVTDDGGGVISERGFKYGLTETDTWSVSEIGEFGEGPYSLVLTNLEPETIYFVRAFATNLKGTSYGSWLSFTTEQPGYYSSGTLISKNLFSGEEVVIINNFYASSTVPVGTALWVQLSTTSQTWYSADGVQDAWTFVSDGQVKFILYNLNWSGSNFYYKMKFETNKAELSPVLDEIILNYNLFHSPYLKGSIRIKGGVILK